MKLLFTVCSEQVKKKTKVINASAGAKTGFKGNKNGNKKIRSGFTQYVLCSQSNFDHLSGTISIYNQVLLSELGRCVLAYDITNHDSFAHIPVWMQEAKKHIEPYKAVFVLVSCHLRP